MAEKTEKQTQAATTEVADPIAALRADFAKQLDDAVKSIKAASAKEIEKAREETMEAHERVDQLQGQLERMQEAPPPGGVGEALKELLSGLKTKDAKEADAHAEQKAANAKKRDEIFAATKKEGGRVFYKTTRPAFLEGVWYPPGSIISHAINEERPELHLPSLSMLPVGDAPVSTELVAIDPSKPTSRASDQSVA